MKSFSKPFDVIGFDGAQAARTHTVCLEDEQWMFFCSSAGARRQRLELTHGGTAIYVALDLQELRGALLCEGDQPTAHPAALASATAQQMFQPRACRS